MKSIEVSARTIEEAVSDGLARLGCSISDCKVEILQEGAKGLFGFFGSKPASVRLTLLSQDAEEEDLGFDLKYSLSSEPRPSEKPAKQAAQKRPDREPAEKKPEPEKKQTEKNKMRFAANPQVVDKPRAAAGSEVLERFRNAPLPGAKQAAEPAPAPEKRAPRPPRARGGRGAERPERVERPERAERQPMPEREPVPAPEHIEMHAPDTLAGRAQEFLLEATKRMGVDVKVEVHTREDGHLYATMYGDTLGILIGRRGETLDALQYLTSLKVNRDREEYTRVTLDTENYRAKREEALTRLAARMASRAVKTGRKVSLEPMNPYERRILHASLQGNPNVSTHSEGDEPYRHVVVVPQK